MLIKLLKQLKLDTPDATVDLLHVGVQLLYRAVPRLSKPIVRKAITVLPHTVTCVDEQDDLPDDSPTQKYRRSTTTARCSC